MREEGYTLRKISSLLDVSLGGVQRTLNRFATTAQFSSFRRSGPPKSTSATTDRLIRRLATANPWAKSSTIKSKLSQHAQIHSSTIRCRLMNDFDLRAYRTAKKPFLSRKNIHDRKVFCKKYEHWSEDDGGQMFIFRQERRS